MVEPNTKPGNFLFNVVIIFAIIGPLILYSIYKGISASCPTDGGGLPVEQKIMKKSNFKYIIIISVLAGLAAQTMNFSYNYMYLRNSVKV